VLEILEIKTHQRTEFVDITAEVATIVRKSKIGEGQCFLFVPHTTAGITLNEHADPDVIKDLENFLEKLVPASNQYRHTEGNSPAHIKSSLLGHSCHLIISAGKLLLGTWQGIFFAEFDGPRTRRVFIEITPV